MKKIEWVLISVLLLLSSFILSAVEIEIYQKCLTRCANRLKFLIPEQKEMRNISFATFVSVLNSTGNLYYLHTNSWGNFYFEQNTINQLSMAFMISVVLPKISVLAFYSYWINKYGWLLYNHSRSNKKKMLLSRVN